jgi:hypothetical protein
MIMRRRPVGEGQKPFQKLDLGLTEAGNLRGCLGPRDDRQQTEKQDLIERIVDFAFFADDPAYPRNGSETQRIQRARRILSCPFPSKPPANHRIPTDSAHNDFVTRFFTRLPWAKAASGFSNSTNAIISTNVRRRSWSTAYSSNYPSESLT